MVLHSCWILRICRNLKMYNNAHSEKGQFRWSRLLNPGKEVQSKQTAGIGRYLWSRGQSKDDPGPFSAWNNVLVYVMDAGILIVRMIHQLCQTDAVAGTFKQQWNLQWSREFRLYAFFACSQSRLYYGWLESPEEVMHQEVGWCYRHGSLWSIVAIDEFAVLRATYM